MAETGNWSPYYITEEGRSLRQRSIGENKQMVFTRAAIGTGKPTDPAVIDNMSGLVAYAKDVIIKKSYSIGANHLCIVRVDNSGYTQDVMMTEVGIYAKINNQADNQAILYGYAYDIDGYILIPAQSSTTNRKIYEVTLDTYLRQSADMEIVYDNSSLFVSHADLDDFSDSLDAGQVSYLIDTYPDVFNVKQMLNTLSWKKANATQLGGMQLLGSLGLVDANKTTPLETVIANMPTRSVLVDVIWGDKSPVYPYDSGQLEIVKTEDNRAVATYVTTGGAIYFKYLNQLVTLTDWTPLATATSGTWTPELSDINGNKAALSTDTYGKWTLIGNIMTVTATIKVTSKAGLDNSGLYINGLPRQASPVYQGGVVGVYYGLSISDSIHIETTGNGKINLYKSDGNGNMIRLTANNITDNLVLEALSISYMV